MTEHEPHGGDIYASNDKRDIARDNLQRRVVTTVTADHVCFNGGSRRVTRRVLDTTAQRGYRLIHCTERETGMTEHVTHVVTVTDACHVYCTCGWMDTWLGDEGAAYDSAAAHKRRHGVTEPPHTPTTSQVEEFWASGGAEQPAAKSRSRAEGVAEFRRWLEQHDRETAARAWDIGHSWGWSDAKTKAWAERGVDIGSREDWRQRTRNPHEQEEA